jgi:hypothetical protein
LLTTDKYLAVFTEYSVAEYSADHYSAEYSADRIVSRSLAAVKVGRSDGRVWRQQPPPMLIHDCALAHEPLEPRTVVKAQTLFGHILTSA